MNEPTRTFPELENMLKGLGCDFFYGGSQVTCDPPPDPQSHQTDFDIVVLDTNEISVSPLVQDSLPGSGFEWDAGENYEFDDAENFLSFSKAIDGVRVNIIVCLNSDFYTKFHNATVLSTKLNLLEKEKRVLLFRSVLYGEY